MNTIALSITYQIESIPGDQPMEKLDNIIIPLSQFIADMQMLGCQVNVSANGRPFIPGIEPTPEQEQAS